MNLDMLERLQTIIALVLIKAIIKKFCKYIVALVAESVDEFSVGWTFLHENLLSEKELLCQFFFVKYHPPPRCLGIQELFSSKAI